MAEINRTCRILSQTRLQIKLFVLTTWTLGLQVQVPQQASNIYYTPSKKSHWISNRAFKKLEISSRPRLPGPGTPKPLKEDDMQRHPPSVPAWNINIQLIKIRLTYGSLFFGSSVPNSLIRSLMLKRRRLSTESKLVLLMQGAASCLLTHGFPSLCYDGFTVINISNQRWRHWSAKGPKSKNHNNLDSMKSY